MATSFATGPLAAQAQSSLLQSRQDHALHQVQSGVASRNDGQIEKGAREFETMLLTTWLQQAQQSMASVPGADDEEDGMSGKEQMTSLGVQALSSALTASGGLGIANMIAKAMHRAADKEEAKVKALQNEPLEATENSK
jgi:Rod binding domain-containing protein